MNALQQIQHIPEQVKIAGDAVSITTVLGAIAGILPAVAALLTIVWTGIRIYETRTVQDWLAKRRKPPA